MQIAVDRSGHPVSEGDGIDNVTGARLAPANHEQAVDFARQRIRVTGQVGKRRLEIGQVGELAYRLDDGVHFEGEFAAGDSLRAAAAALIGRHAFAALGKLNADYLPVVSQHPGGDFTFEQVNPFRLGGVHLPLVSRQLSSRSI